MNKLTDKEKIERLRGLYNKFHFKIVALKKRQTELLKKAKKLVEEKKLREIRDRIKK